MMFAVISNKYTPDDMEEVFRVCVILIANIVRNSLCFNREAFDENLSGYIELVSNAEAGGK